MSDRKAVTGVALPSGYTGSSYLHALLRSAVEAFPEALATADVPADARVFKKDFGAVLARFEAARAHATARVDIAEHLRSASAAAMRFCTADDEVPLAQAVAQERSRPTLRQIATQGPGRLCPSVPVDGEEHVGEELRRWLTSANEHRYLTDAARERVERLLDRAEADEGCITLRGERFALLGAGAELAPTRLLLAAGADVLWIDLREPPDDLVAATDLGGTLHVPERPSDLLADPAGVVAAVRAFADGAPVHVGMYAYAGGEGQEWRLTASMNAIAVALGPQVVRSLSLLISPTTVAVASARDLEIAEQRRAEAGLWKRALHRLGALRAPGVASGSDRVNQAIVPVQGASYQAAQYIGKIIAAESFGVRGLPSDGARSPLLVSANVAPITATRSLEHPLFQAGFLGAPVWDVFISTPLTTRALNGLLTVGDLTDVQAPGHPDGAARGAERARALFSEQVHGGVFAQPWAVYGEIQVAAVVGLAKRPKLLLGLLRGR